MLFLTFVYCLQLQEFIFAFHCFELFCIFHIQIVLSLFMFSYLPCKYCLSPLFFIKFFITNWRLSIKFKSGKIFLLYNYFWVVHDIRLVNSHLFISDVCAEHFSIPCSLVSCLTCPKLFFIFFINSNWQFGILIRFYNGESFSFGSTLIL